ncbi:MAG: radical SAM protein [Methanomassiliicoccus sp.]|nr:radical SAM protein [Methanomassiliicoccus sp.]
MTRLPSEDSALDAMYAHDSPATRQQSSHFYRMAPFRLQIECASECSAECSYCYARSVPTGEPLSSRELKGILRRAAGLGIRQIDWMGGDPMERPDWIDLLQTARYNGMTNNLWTCGARLNDVGQAKWAIDLTRGGYIMVHLDSLDPDVLRSMRSSYNPRTTRDTLRGIELLLDMGKSPREIGNLLMMTNAQDVEDIGSTMTHLYDSYGIRTCLMSLKPVDETGKLYPLLPRPEDVAEAYRLRDSIFMSGKGMGCQDFPREYCGTTLFMSLDGRVSSCYSLRRYIGSVRENTLEDIVAAGTSSLFFTGFRNYSEEVVCGACDKELCWGCRANAFYFGGGAYLKDPICPLNVDQPKGHLPY